MEDINNLLNAGEVPNLFPLDEKQEITEKMRALDRQRDKAKQTDGSPVALVNCCTIDWFQPWPQDALEAVANKAFEEIDLSASDLRGCIESCKYFHMSTLKLSARFHSQLGRYNYVTPTSYLELIGTFKGLLDKQRE